MKFVSNGLLFFQKLLKLQENKENEQDLNLLKKILRTI